MDLSGAGLGEIDYRMLGRRIRQCRQSRGFSQEELAEMINSSKNHLGYVETAKRSVSLVMLVRIANALEVSIEDLLADSLEVVNSEEGSPFGSMLSDCSDRKTSMIVDAVRALDKVLSENGVV